MEAEFRQALDTIETLQSTTSVSAWSESIDKIKERINLDMKTRCVRPAFLLCCLNWQLRKRTKGHFWFPSFEKVLGGQLNHHFWVKLFTAHPGSLAWVIHQAILQDERNLDELAHSLFPSLFCQFIEENMNERACLFLIHLMELCSRDIEKALPFLATFVFGCYSFHDRLWSSLEMNRSGTPSERLQAALRVAWPQLHNASILIARLKVMSFQTATTFLIRDVLCYSLKYHGMFDDIVDYLMKLSSDSVEAKKLWNVVDCGVNEQLCVWDTVPGLIPLYFKAGTLALFLEIANQFPVEFSPHDMALEKMTSFSVLYNTMRQKLQDNSDDIVFIQIQNFINKGAEVMPQEKKQEKRSDNFKFIWGRLKSEYAQRYVNPLTFLPLISKPRTLVSFSKDIGEILKSREFTRFALEQEIDGLHRREEEIAHAIRLKNIETMIQKRIELLTSCLRQMLISSCQGPLAVHFNVQSRSLSAKKIVNCVSKSLRVVEERKLDMGMWTFPLIIANLNKVVSEPVGFDAVLKTFDFEDLQKQLNESDSKKVLEALPQTVENLKMLTNLFVNAPCGLQIELLLQLAENLEQTVDVCCGYDFTIRPTDLLLCVLPRDKDQFGKFLSSFVRISQIEKLLLSNNYKIPEFHALEKLISWVIEIVSHSEHFLEQFMKCLSLEFGQKLVS